MSSNRYMRSEARFLLGLARQLYVSNPKITGAEMARQLGLSRSQGYSWLRRARDGMAVEDPVELTRKLLQHQPQATGADVAAMLGVSVSSGSYYKTLATRNRPTAAASAPAPRRELPAPKGYAVPVFRKIK